MAYGIVDVDFPSSSSRGGGNPAPTTKQQNFPQAYQADNKLKRLPLAVPLGQSPPKVPVNMPILPNSDQVLFMIRYRPRADNLQFYRVIDLTWHQRP